MIDFESFTVVFIVFFIGLLIIGALTMLIVNGIARLKMREEDDVTAACGHITKMEGTLQLLGKEGISFLLLTNEDGHPEFCFDCLQKAVPDCNDGLCSIEGGDPVAISLKE